MRIDSGYRFSTSAQRTPQHQNHDLIFETTLKEMEKREKQEEDKQGEKKGKLVTIREGAYVRQYLVRSDGSKVLLSELQQDTDAEPTENYQRPPGNILSSQSEGSQNTKEMMSLLNHQVGAGMAFQINKQLLNGGDN